MAKEKELATKTEARALALTGDDAAGLVVEGRDGGASRLSRLALFNNTADENKRYGRKEWGDFIDTLSGETLGPKVKVMPVAGWMTWSRWEKGAKVPVYSYTRKSDVPPEDLEWQGDEKPRAVEAVNVVLVVEGQPWPYLFTFKKTGLKTYTKVIEPMETRRGITQRGPGLYELYSEDDANPDGQPYKRVVARFVGDPTAEMIEMARAVRASIAHVKSQAAEMQSKEDIPF